MNIPSDSELLTQIEAFLDETGMTPTRLGIEATGEGGLVKSIRDGRSMTLRTGRRLVGFMETYRDTVADHASTDTASETTMAGGKSGDFTGREQAA